MSPDEVRSLIEGAGGTIKEIGLLPDKSGFATATFPLSDNHWIHGDPLSENEPWTGEQHGFEVPPMIFKTGTSQNIKVVTEDINETMSRSEMADRIRMAGRYAIRVSTNRGKEDFDPDALLQNLVVGMLGYWTPDGLSADDWVNAKRRYQKGKAE